MCYNFISINKLIIICHRRENMKGCYNRAIHIDFHTNAGIEDINNFDVQKFVDTIASVNPTYVNVFAECNRGYCYYPTKIGNVYPGLKRDLLGEMIDAFHKKGIGVTAYFNAGISAQNAVNHSEWVKKTNGKSVNAPYVLCFNTEYTTFLKSLVQEVLDNYEVDGIFLDCFQHGACACEKCQKDMLAQGIDLNDKEQTYNFNEKLIVGFCQEIRKIVEPKHLFCNGMDWDKDYDDHIELECLPNTSTWSEYLPSFMAFTRYCNKETTYMTGRFAKSWGDFGGIVAKASLENDMYDSVMYGTGFCIGDHAHPSKGLSPSLYETIKDIYSQVEKYQKYSLNTKYLSDIAIITNTQTYLWDYFRGASRLLLELNYTFDIIYSDADFSKYKVIILPDCITLTDSVAKKLENYMNNGGKIISFGKGALNVEKSDFAISEYKKYLTFEGLDTRKYSFFEITDNFAVQGKGVEWSTYYPSIYMSAKGGEVLAEDVSIYFDYGENEETNVFNYYIPPKEKSGKPSIVATDNFAHVSFNLLEGYSDKFPVIHRDVLKALLNKYLPNPVIVADELPISSRVSVLKGDGYSLLNVKVDYPESKGYIGIINEHNTLAKGKKVLVKGRFKKAFDPINKRKIKVKNLGDYTQVVLPEIVGFIMIVLI